MDAILGFFKDPISRVGSLLALGVLFFIGVYSNQRLGFSTLVGLTLGLLSITFVQSLQNILWAIAGFNLAGFLLTGFKILPKLTNGETDSLPVMLKILLMTTLFSHAPWIVAVPLGYGVRKILLRRR